MRDHQGWAFVVVDLMVYSVDQVYQYTLQQSVDDLHPAVYCLTLNEEMNRDRVKALQLQMIF